MNRSELLMHLTKYYLKTEPEVQIIVDPRSPFVKVPEYLKGAEQIVLDIGSGIARPIDDLRVVRTGISGTMSFSLSPFRVFIPWTALLGIAAGKRPGMFRPDSTPETLEAEAATVPKKDGRGRPRKPTNKERAMKLGIRRIK